MPRSFCRTLSVTVLALAGVLLTARPAATYSVLGHEGVVDAVWDQDIVPLLRERFGNLTAAQLQDARAHAYGGRADSGPRLPSSRRNAAS